MKMCANNSRNDGECNSSTNTNECHILGPFRAIDAVCITPSTQRSTGAIIPFSSGTVTVILTSAIDAAPATASLIGFSSAITNINILNSMIDLSFLPSTEAFSIPRTGNITAISASFTAFAATSLVENTAIRAQIYRAPAQGTIFTPTNALVDLTPAFTVPFSINQTVSGLTTIMPPVSVSVEDRLLMVFSVLTPPDTIPIVSISGTASAGITVE